MKHNFHNNKDIINSEKYSENLENKSNDSTALNKIIYSFLVLSILPTMIFGIALGYQLVHSYILTKSDANYPSWHYTDITPWISIPLIFVVQFGPPIILGLASLYATSFYSRKVYSNTPSTK